MRSLIAWSIRQTPAMNTIMVAIVGLLGSCPALRCVVKNSRSLTWRLFSIAVPYPGASPEEVETGICQKIEEAIRAVEGIKKDHIRRQRRIRKRSRRSEGRCPQRAEGVERNTVGDRPYPQFSRSGRRTGSPTGHVSFAGNYCWHHFTG